MRWAVAAGAVKAAVGAARAAVAAELLAKVFAGAVKPDGEIVFRQAKFSRNRSDIVSVEINTLKQFAILFRHGGQQSFEALTQQSFLARSGFVRQFLFKPLKGAGAGVIAPVKVNDAAAKNPVEPRHGVRFSLWLPGRGQRLDQTFLHDILRKIRVAEALAGKCHEGLQVLQDRVGSGFHTGSVAFPSILRNAPCGRRTFGVINPGVMR